MTTPQIDPEIEYLCRAPLNWWNYDPVPVYSLGDVVAQALRQLRTFHNAVVWSRHIDDRRLDYGSESALLFECDPGVVHIVGIGVLADQVRRHIDAGSIPGWAVLQLPEDRTPLNALKPLLNRHCYEVLRRHEFTSAEEVAAVPDQGLLAFQNAGPKFLGAVRQATSIVIPNRLSPAAVAPPQGRYAAIVDALARLDAAAITIQDDLESIRQALRENPNM